MKKESTKFSLGRELHAEPFQDEQSVISSYQSREVWPPTTVSTSFKILSAVGSRVLRLRWLEADFIVSGFPCFYSPFPASTRLLLGVSGSSSESGQANIFAAPASASTAFSFPHPLSSSLSPPTGDGRRQGDSASCRRRPAAAAVLALLLLPPRLDSA